MREACCPLAWGGGARALLAVPLLGEGAREACCPLLGEVVCANSSCCPPACGGTDRPAGDRGGCANSRRILSSQRRRFVSAFLQTNRLGPDPSPAGGVANHPPRSRFASIGPPASRGTAGRVFPISGFRVRACAVQAGGQQAGCFPPRVSGFELARPKQGDSRQGVPHLGLVPGFCQFRSRQSASNLGMILGSAGPVQSRDSRPRASNLA